MRPEVYEQLARTFLDKKKSKPEKKSLSSFWLIVGICTISVLLLAIISLFFIRERTSILEKSLYIALDKTPAVISYNFNNPNADRIKAASFSLGNTDISKYGFLSFRLRLSKQASLDSAIKVQLENSFKEASHTYIKGVSSQWRRFSLPLSEFKHISDYTAIQSLSFVIEGWNLADKENKVLIDEIRFVK